MATIKPSTMSVINYLKENPGVNVTSADLSEILGLTKKQVDGIFTSAIQRKELGFREEAEIENADGTHTKVKFLRLNEAGMAYEPPTE